MVFRTPLVLLTLVVALVFAAPSGAVTPTYGQLQVQFNRADSNGWVRVFKAVEADFSLPRGLLLALGSRETNLNDVVGDGGHGRGVLQIDDRWHKAFLAKHRALASGRVPPVKAAARYAAKMLVWNRTNGLASGVPMGKGWRFAVAAYNAGFTGVLNALRDGEGVDGATTGGDYSKDVRSRRRTFVGILDAPKLPEKFVRRPDIELDARSLVAAHGGTFPVRAVLHSTESPNYEGVKDLFGIASYWSRVSWGPGAHLTIDCDGNTALNLNERELGYHVSGRNTGSLGIEQIGYARYSRVQWLACPRQLEKVAKWLAYWHEEFDLSLRHDPERGVSTHNEQSHYAGLAGGHWDPGPGYPFSYVMHLARKYAKEGW
jgi:hypothetical protein